MGARWAVVLRRCGSWLLAACVLVLISGAARAAVPSITNEAYNSATRTITGWAADGGFNVDAALFGPGGQVTAYTMVATYTGNGDWFSYSYQIPAAGAYGGYFVRVRSRRGAFETADGTTYQYAAPVPSPPGAPSGLTATAGSGQVSLSWGAVTGATGYRVYQGAALIASPAGTSHIVTGLTNGVAVTFQVSAVGAGGEGPKSSAVSATPTAPAAPPPPPTGGGGSGGSVSYSALATVAKTEVLRAVNGSALVVISLVGVIVAVGLVAYNVRRAAGH